ncbi:VOC family protein [Xenorhabdus sp. PB30.3]|uniref:VOC family protein n=1 Tax=Xenorhabdus sp. PB30.3 TaxID=2788941 RepID=UPI001E636F88|nr:VOC family protein [Xenorhabdus sp. PB30.3]MCC8382017.1 VOC family protein [Xenorhabdus sp. PB30.3]
MTLLKIDHVQLAMPKGEEDTARKFYIDILGLTEIQKPENLAKRGGCWFISGEVQVHLGVQEDFYPGTKAHPAFLVDNLNQLRKLCTDAGYKCQDDVPIEGFNRFHVYDPFGNRIELMEIL